MHKPVEWGPGPHWPLAPHGWMFHVTEIMLHYLQVTCTGKMRNAYRSLIKKSEEMKQRKRHRKEYNVESNFREIVRGQDISSLGVQ
jgi:hypothetical protein